MADYKRLSSGVVVVNMTADHPRFLLLRAFTHWDFPKGMVEDGESPIDAAVREVEEETTLDDLDFVWGNDYVETGPYSRGKTARYYVAQTRREDVSLPVNPDLGRPEHNEFRWVFVDEAHALTSPRVQPVISWAARVINL